VQLSTTILLNVAETKYFRFIAFDDCTTCPVLASVGPITFCQTPNLPKLILGFKLHLYTTLIPTEPSNKYFRFIAVDDSTACRMPASVGPVSFSRTPLHQTSVSLDFS
jgi:hypothetical protein